MNKRMKRPHDRMSTEWVLSPSPGGGWVDGGGGGVVVEMGGVVWMVGWWVGAVVVKFPHLEKN